MSRREKVTIPNASIQIQTAKLQKFELNEIKRSLVSAIFEKYGMGVKEFARSKIAQELKLPEKSLANYLSSGASSLPVLKKLCKHFGFGELTKTVIVKREEFYYLPVSELPFKPLPKKRQEKKPEQFKKTTQRRNSNRGNQELLKGFRSI